MSDSPATGRITPEVFNGLIMPRLGAKDEGVLAGTQPGVDAAIVEIGGQAASFASNTLFIVPEFGWEKAAWFAFHSLASVSAACGLPPKYLSVNLSLPAEVTDEQLTILWETIHRECEKMGVAIVGAQVARFKESRFPAVGGASLTGTGFQDRYVGPAFIKPGDRLIITKGPAIQAAGMLAGLFPIYIEQSLGKDTARKAAELFYKMSTVTDAAAAITGGLRDEGVSGMHNASDGGIWGGLYEMSEAAGVGVRVDVDRIVVEPGVVDVCRLYGLDPYASASIGTLLIACRPQRSDDVVRLIKARGIRASIAGEFTPREGGMILVKGGNPRPLVRPVSDAFWKQFFDALARVKNNPVRP